MRFPSFERFLGTLFRTHCLASWITGAATAVFCVGFHPLALLELELPIFLSPLIVPWFLMGDTHAQFNFAIAAYVLLFVPMWILVRRYQIRQEKRDNARFQESLEKWRARHSDQKKLGKTELVAIVAAVVAILQIVILFGVSAYMDFTLPTAVLWILLLPCLVAIVAGFAGCLFTKPDTNGRQAVFVSLCVGIFLGAFCLAALYSRLAGLYYD